MIIIAAQKFYRCDSGPGSLTGECYVKEQKCDGIKQCLNGEDEKSENLIH